MFTKEKLVLWGPWVLIASYAFLVFSQLTTFPGLWLDEGFKMQLARNFADTGIMGMQFEPGEVVYNIHSASTGWPIAAILGGFFKIFGTSLVTARIYSSLFLIGTVILLYYLSKKLWGSKVGVFVLLLLVTFAPLYSIGKMVLSEVPSIFWLVAGLALSFSRLRPLNKALLMGIFFGLFAAGKLQFAGLLFPSLFLAHVYALKSKTMTWGEVLITWFISASLVLPTLWMSLQKIPGSGGGVGLTNIYASACRLCDVGSNLVLFTRHTTLMYLAILFLLAIVASVIYVRKRETVSWQTVFLVLFALGDLAYFLLSPQVFRYLLPLQIILLVFAPWALGKILAAYRGSKYIWAGQFLLLALVLVQAVHFVYFADIARSDDVVRFEQFAKTNLNEDESIGAVNSSFTSVLVPLSHFRQFVHFPGREEGHNFLRDAPELWPDVIIYEPYNYRTDVEPYLPQLKKLYSSVATFGGIYIWKKI